MMEPVEEDHAEKKTTQLLLNTPGVCFLCLQDYKKDDKGGPDEQLNGGIIDLTTVCRYLNINQCSLLLTSLENGGDSSVEALGQDLCKFSVNLCPKCLQLTKMLTDTIVQLEKAKLMVNYHLHSFHKVLEGNKEEGSVAWINLLKRMNTNSDNSLETKLVQRLREETRNKSFKILKKAKASMPQIILSRCQPPPPPPLPKTSCCPPSSKTASASVKTLLSQHVAANLLPSTSHKSHNYRLYRCPYCTKILGSSKFSLHLSSLHSDKLLSLYFPPPSLPPSELTCRLVLHTKVVANSPKISPSSTSSFRRWGCYLCGLSYSNSNVLRHHFLLTHTDKLCEEIKTFKNIPKENPTKLPIIKNIREEEKDKKVKNKISKQIPGKKVPKINKLKSPNPVRKLIKRFLQTSIIQDPSTKITQQVQDTDNSKFLKRYQCPFCGKTPVYSKFASHLTNLHPDKLLTPTTNALKKLQNDNPTFFRQLCSKVLASQVTLAVKRMPVKRWEDTTSPPKICCHLCSRKYSEKQNLKHHIVVNHTDYLKEQLIKVQSIKAGVQDKQKKEMVIKTAKQLKVKPLKEMSFKQKPLNTKPFNDKPLKDKALSLRPSKDKQLQVKLLKKKRLRGPPPPRSVEHRTCTICRLTYSKYDKLQRHLVNQHPDQLFLKCKPSWMGVEQFRGNCKEIFKLEVGKATYGKPGDKNYKCDYCPGGSTTYRGEHYLLIHLAYQHRREMEDIIMDKLEEEEEEEEANDNVFCEGGDDEGGDHMVIEEDASEYDMKPDIGELGEMMYPDMVLDELNDKEEGYQETDDNLDQFQPQCGYLDEEGVGGDDKGTMMMTDEQLDLPDNQSAPRPIIKMEVNEALIFE